MGCQPGLDARRLKRGAGVLIVDVHGIVVDVDVRVGEAVPDAEVTVFGGCGVGGQHRKEAEQLIGAPVRLDVVLALAGTCWIGQEPKPGIGVEAGRAEAHKLVPWQLAVDDPVRGREFPAGGERHVPVLPRNPVRAHLPVTHRRAEGSGDGVSDGGEGFWACSSSSVR